MTALAPGWRPTVRTPGAQDGRSRDREADRGGGSRQEPGADSSGGPAGGPWRSAGTGPGEPRTQQRQSQSPGRRARGAAWRGEQRARLGGARWLGGAPLTARPPQCTLLLLLLLLSPSLLGTPNCSFPYNPISSNFRDKFNELSDYLLQDYPVTLAANLQEEQLCGKLWHLVLAQRWMERLKTVAGLKMQKLLEMVNTEIHFVTVCAFQDTVAQLEAMKPWITHRNFSQCLELRCQPGTDPSTALPPRSPGAREATELPTPASQSLLLLLLLPLAALLLLPTVWYLLRLRCRPRGGPGSS